MRRCGFIAGLIVGFGALCWVAPPFRIVPLQRAQAAKAQAAFNPVDYAARFWTERLLPSLDKAPDAATLLQALAANPRAAATNYGRTLGMSDAVFYLLRGTGTVVSVEPKGVGVVCSPGFSRSASAEASPNDATLLLKTGLLFGNTVRDATGLLSASAFPNSQDFNDLSTELNHIVETQVFRDLKTKAAAGRKIRFVVAAEVEADTEVEQPLKVIPLRVEFE
jgi:predicted lipoprotein